MSEKLLNNDAFLEKYNIQRESFEKTGLEWNVLEEIYADHVKNASNLKPIANYIDESLRLIKEVHSLRIRIKDPEHLVEKIIRKKLENNEFDVTLKNYKEKITDLVGVRALHLFKEDWNNIHDYVVETWELSETPTANVRKGDPEEYTRQFTEKGCEINEHKFNYRSVHYLIKSQPSKKIFIAELQVRTIFEEGWSEIDHSIRYPYDLENVILAQVSAIHNRLSGSADEIGSFIKILKKELNDRDNKYKNVLEEQDKVVKELNSKIQELEITEAQKTDLENRVNSLSSNALQGLFMPDMRVFAQAIANIKLPSLDPSVFAAAKLFAQPKNIELKSSPSSEKKEGKVESAELREEKKREKISSVRKTSKRKTEKKS
ncbi:MAG: RelA/SpoT domain-containing protein [Pyrinomonadaceae bacterium]